jgi:RNA polymerase sigma-70 factor (ECF subfamily)
MLARFEASVMPHLPYLGRVARRISRPPIDPDDLVQDTLMRAWKYWGTFSPDSNCQAWLVRILTNVLKIHFAKTAGLRESLPIDDLYRVALAGPPTTFSFDADQILDILPQPNRRLVTMIVIEGYSYAETARALGVPIGTIMSRLSRSRRKLARELIRRDEAVFRSR